MLSKRSDREMIKKSRAYKYAVKCVNDDTSGQYPDFTKEQYAARALELVQSAADGKRILGYKMSDVSITRYDVKENDYVK